ncbi:MAG TPA: SBBP repeat-containing protein, partial [Planctomycetota bacterium]|nr:SBBP repeat-containing protein [Planctomycetota bacterium]
MRGSLRDAMFTILAAALGAAPALAQTPPAPSLVFEANRGQTDGSVQFLSRGRGYTLFLTSTEAVLALVPPGSTSGPPEVLRLRLVGARASAEATGLDALPGRSHYFIGRDPAKWRTDVPHYARVQYRDVYPGVDLVYYGNEGRLEFDLVVAPGVDPDAIRLDVGGASGLEIDAGGDLVLRAAGGDVRLGTPHVYQETGSDRRAIPGRYVLHARAEGEELPLVGFELGDYDRSRPLVIDPLLRYSSYLGGDDNDDGLDIAVDGAGNMYVVGTTRSADFPTAHAVQPGYSGGVCQNPLGQTFPCSDIFVTKLGPDGSTILYSTYLG